MSTGAGLIGLICCALLVTGVYLQVRLWKNCSPLKAYAFLSDASVWRAILLLFYAPYVRLYDLLTAPEYPPKKPMRTYGQRLRTTTYRDLASGSHRLLREAKARHDARRLQRKHKPSEREAIRINLAGSLSLCIIVGFSVFAIFEIIDPRMVDSDLNRLGVLAAIGIFAILFFLKMLLSPTLLACTASWALYTWFQYDSPELFPIFQFTIKATLEWAPDWIRGIYSYVYIFYSAVSVLWSSYDADAWPLKYFIGE